MKITKTQLKQIIAEELAEARVTETTGGSEEALLAALRATGERSWSPREIADVAKVAAEAARYAALDADPYSQAADVAVYNAIIEYFRSKKRMA